MKFSFAIVLALCAAGALADGKTKHHEPVSKSIAAGAVAGTGDILSRPVALINKNDVIFGNNVFIAKSKLIFTQNDRFALIKKVEAELKKETNVGTAVLTKNVLRAVSAPKTDAVLMSKASAVIAARGDKTMLSKTIADFVDTAAKMEMAREAKHHEHIPNDVLLMIGTKSVLSQPAAVVNKNVALSDNQITVTRSKMAPTANDRVTLKDDAKVAGLIAPQSRIRVGSIKMTKTETEHEKEAAQYRTAFMYHKVETKDGKKEFCGWGLGWRYPLGWWGLHGGGCGLGWGAGCGCGLGFAAGPWFYC